MPTYEYVCHACEHRFERFQKMSAPPVRVCPECGRRKVKRLISTGGGVVFKGPGFYATDYRKGAPPSTDKKSPGEKSAGVKKSPATSTEKGGEDE